MLINSNTRISHKTHRMEISEKDHLVDCVDCVTIMNDDLSGSLVYHYKFGFLFTLFVLL